MTRVVLIEAGPTQWDVEERLAGAHSLPLTDEAVAAIRERVAQLDVSIDAVYRSKANEAADQAARLAAQRFGLRPRDNAALNEVKVGLWEGLKHSEIKTRFPSTFPLWRENATAVIPPEGESLEDAIARLRDALRTVLRRNRGRSLVLALRPMALQAVRGILRREPPRTIAEHLHDRCPVETIEIDDSLEL